MPRTTRLVITTVFLFSILLSVISLAIGQFIPLRMPNDFSDVDAMCSSEGNAGAYDLTNVSCIDPGAAASFAYFWNETVLDAANQGDAYNINNAIFGTRYTFTSAGSDDIWTLDYGFASTPETCTGVTYTALASGTGGTTQAWTWANASNTSAVTWTNLNNTCWRVQIDRVGGSDAWTMRIDGFHVQINYTPEVDTAS